MTTTDITPTSSATDFDFHATVTAAEQFGFEGPGAFLTAMLLRSSGVSASGAVKLFQDAARWIQ